MAEFCSFFLSFLCCFYVSAFVVNKDLLITEAFNKDLVLVLKIMSYLRYVIANVSPQALMFDRRMRLTTASAESPTGFVTLVIPANEMNSNKIKPKLENLR